MLGTAFKKKGVERRGIKREVKKKKRIWQIGGKKCQKKET